jgi:hypothetical protein
LKQFQNEKWSSPSISPMDSNDATKQCTLSGTVVRSSSEQHTMHRSIACTVEACVTVLHLPSKTTRACEAVFEAIYLLVTRRYVMGVAGLVANDDSGENINNHTTNNDIGVEEANTAMASTSLLYRLLESCATIAIDVTIDTVQTAVIKVLRAVATSPVCGIHNEAMLTALRAPFHVYLVSKSSAVRTNAKSALLDMLRTVFLNLEAYNVIHRQQQQQQQQQLLMHPSEVQVPSLTAATHATTTSNEESLVSGTAHSPDSVENVPHGPLSSSSFVSQYHTDAYVLLRGLCRMSAKDLPVDDGVDTNGVASIIDRHTFPRLYHAFNANSTDPLDLESKILSLELILAALEYGGDAFHASEKFVHLVQTFLCVSLLKNCMSHHTQVAYLSQKIFLVLVSCRS